MKKFITLLLLFGSTSVIAQNAPDSTKTKVIAPIATNATRPAPAKVATDTSIATQVKGSMQAYKGKTYVFDSNFSLYSCDAVGANQSKNPVIIYQGFLFQVVCVYTIKNETNLIIKFNQFSKTNIDQRLKYNFKLSDSILATTTKAKKLKLSLKSENDENAIYFVISVSDFSSFCSEYTSPRSSSLTFGTFTTPFKFRPTKSLFSSDLTLGAVAYFNISLNENWSHGAAIGLSLTSVTLDSLSTNGKVKSSSERPALTPSLSYVLTYKGVSFTIGAGIDYVNKTTGVESSWIFNGKPWFGFGIGVNLFGAGAAKNTTPANTSQGN